MLCAAVFIHDDDDAIASFRVRFPLFENDTERSDSNDGSESAAEDSSDDFSNDEERSDDESSLDNVEQRTAVVTFLVAVMYKNDDYLHHRLLQQNQNER